MQISLYKLSMQDAAAKLLLSFFLTCELISSFNSKSPDQVDRKSSLFKILLSNFYFSVICFW